jgi:hypothetical protein
MAKRKKDEKHTVDILLNASDIAKAGAAEDSRFTITMDCNTDSGLRRWPVTQPASAPQKPLLSPSAKAIP